LQKGFSQDESAIAQILAKMAVSKTPLSPGRSPAGRLYGHPLETGSQRKRKHRLQRDDLAGISLMTCKNSKQRLFSRNRLLIIQIK